MTKLETIVTGDGSTSFFTPLLDETYHSRHGAIQEAKHVFINTGLEHAITELNLESISIFEMGFGTGLNCLLTGLWSSRNSFSINYTGIENTVLTKDQLKLCNYIDEVVDENCEQLFDEIHSSTWNEEVGISQNFKLTKLQSEIEEFNNINQYNLIYYDAFGPRVQPHLWEIPVLKKMLQALKPGGYFVTYCAKGSVRRNLIEIGFEIERMPGPPGKREMLRARKPL